MAVDVRPVTPDRWDDLVALFGDRGAYSGCWCRWFQQSSAEFAANAHATNRALLQQQVRTGPVPGLLAYLGARPVGWVAVEPRAAYPRLDRSRVTKPIDDSPVWSVVCFYVDRKARGSGVMRALLDAAVDWARDHGATTIEGYPVDPAGGAGLAAASAFLGVASVFRSAGFTEVARRKDRRPVMRLPV